MRVGLYGERSVEMVIGLVGIMKAGGAYVAIEGDVPEQRLGMMLEEGQIGMVVVTREEYREKGQGYWMQVVSLEGEWEEIEKESGEDLEKGEGRGEEGGAAAEVRAENLAYVIYTSGSSGRPKAVGIEHRQVVNYVRGMGEKLGLKECESYVLVSSLGADLGYTAVYPALTGGGRLYVAPEWESGEMEEYLEREKVDCMKITPTHLRAMAWKERGAGVLPGKRLVLGGEAAEEGWVRWLEEQGGGCEVWNHYGPTECTVGVVAYRVGSGEAEGEAEREREREKEEAGKRGGAGRGRAGRGRAGRVAMGRPAGNMEVYVVDEEMKLAPVGAAGELYIGGAGVGRGYLGRAELTAERFVPNPFSEERRGEGKERRGGGERLYRTGDRVRWRWDGNLEFLGRKDEQVKVRGYRIEVGEIEAVLREQVGVKQAAVVVKEVEVEGGEGKGESGGVRKEKRLVGYVEVEERGKEKGGEQELSGVELKRYLRQRLPEYMVPGSVVVVESLPMLGNGKVDRRGLEKLGDGEEGKGRREERYAGPRTPVEEIVAGVWGEVLGLKRVGVEENFFELGGHSLLATQVVARVRQALGVEISLRVLFETPTVAAMAWEVEQQRRGAVGRKPIPGVKKASRREGEAGKGKGEVGLPLSYGQQRLWFLEQLEPGSGLYNVAHRVRLEGELKEAALGRSVQEMIRRHEVLRSRIVMEEGSPVQKVMGKEWAEEAMAMEVVDVSGGGRELKGGVEEEARRIAQAEGQRCFDLEQGPLLRVKLLRLGEEDHVLLLTMHHIVSDGWSIGIIMRELRELYEVYAEGKESRLEELGVQYGDYAVWQRAWLQGEVLEEQLGYWRRELEGVKALELASDYARPRVLNHRGGRVAFHMGEEMRRKVEELERREGVTLFMVLLTGFAVVLGRWSGEQDVTVGTPIANRRHVETEGLIGCFINQLVLRTRWEEGESLSGLLRRVREKVVEGYEHQDVPFEKLVEELEPERV